ncbi:MAG: flagellar hook-length control protein FliK [Gammaproteobacteria bacterium]
MPDAVALAPAAPKAMSSKGLMEQEVAPADEGQGESFATLVDTLLPAAAPGAELPVDTAALPADAAWMLATLGSATAAAAPMDPAADLPMAEDLSRVLHGLRPAMPRAPGNASASASPTTDPRTSTDPEADATDDLPFGAWRANARQDTGAVTDPATAAPAGDFDLAAFDLPEGTGTPVHAPGAGTERTTLPEPARLQLDSRLPVTTPQFVDRFAEQVTVLVEHGVKHAQLSLNPAELGPIDVRITFHRDEATVQFASHHGAVRDAVADALPKLREMLDGAGVRLGDSGVFAQLPQRETPADGRAGHLPREQARASHETLAESPAVATRLSLGLIDAYA